VPDYFALLNEPRRPWLDAEALKAKFLSLSSAVHPDRVHHASEPEKAAANRQFTELNAAYHCLCESRERLRHLLELELGRKPSDLTNVPDDLMDLFFAVGKALRDADAFVAEKAKASSPLLQVQFFERGQERTEQLGGLRQSITTRRESLVNELKTLSASWATATDKPLERLLQIWRLLSFYERWLAQIQERVVQLSF
jgi:curved DNA-binding protein CbpA